MVKTETKIAEENILIFEDKKTEWDRNYKYMNKLCCATHKASCQRFLEFLENKQKQIDDLIFDLTNGFGQNEYDVDLDKEITDLKNAIKKYDEAGI